VVRWSPSHLGKLHRVSVPVTCKGTVAEAEPAIRQGPRPRDWSAPPSPPGRRWTPPRRPRPRSGSASRRGSLALRSTGRGAAGSRWQAAIERPLSSVRPHGDRGGRYGGEPALLSGCLDSKWLESARTSVRSRLRTTCSALGSGSPRCAPPGPGSRAARTSWHREPAAPAPVDLKANDLAYWQIHFVVSDAEAASSAARAARGGADQSRGRGP